MLTANEIRHRFLEYFKKHGHTEVASSSLIPRDDPSLLFTNAGMVQFKKIFCGQEKRDYVRATTSQKCLGGKHNDLDNVGRTARHHTFFEMLGNFSFGDYFKEDAIRFAWTFITEDLKLPKDRLYITVYKDDDEAFELWQKVAGVAPERIFRLGEKDNFWSMGDTGPCGPCSEIHFDQGADMACGPDCGIGKCDCDRFLEIWNLVFMQFEQLPDGSRVPLPRPSIDTGMGLERIAGVCQGVRSNYDTDLFQVFINYMAELAGVRYRDNADNDTALRVIADHSRAIAFMIADGILPSNEGRGYVMRRLLRRAARHGRMLGIDRPFLTELVDTVIESSEAGYPELREHESYIKKVIGTEEQRFGRTIDAGLSILNGMMGRLKEAHEKVLSGVEAFKLNDTFGFPLDLTREIAAEAGLAVDEAAFHIEMTKQRERARAERLAKDISGWSADLFGELTAEPTRFDGYETLSEKARVLALSDGEELVDAIATDEAGEVKEGVLVVLDKTPFYAEMGGQVADHGYLVSGDAKLKVTQVKKTPKGYFVHTCELLDGTIHVDDEVTASVDEKRRAAICRNHTATHLLQKALREVLGEHVHQAGSYQDDQITHFDFTHFSAVSPAELAEVERRVNEKIYEALPVTVKNLPIEEAKKMGAMALFGEKYGSVVRVVDAGGWSTEFCGGTHVTNTAQIGCFKILSESSVAAGIRRIEATTAFGVLDLLDDRTETLAKTAVALKANNLKDAPARAEALAAELKETAKQLDILKAQVAASKIDGLFEDAADVDGVRIVSAYLTGTGADTLRDMVDKVRDKAPNAVTVLIGSDGAKTMMAVGVSKNAMARGLKAGALVKKIAAIAGGNGGGKPDFAMAGIRDTSKIDDALNAVPEIVKAEMNQ